MDYHMLAEEFFAALCARPHGPWRRHEGEPQKKTDPSRGEFPVLKYLYDVGEPVMPSRISAERQLTSARIANILASLEKKGLVERGNDPADRRRVLVRLTDAGRSLTESKRQEALEDIQWLLGQMGEADARELIRLEWKMTQIIASNLENRDGGRL